MVGWGKRRRWGRERRKRRYSSIWEEAVGRHHFGFADTAVVLFFEFSPLLLIVNHILAHFHKVIKKLENTHGKDLV